MVVAHRIVVEASAQDKKLLEAKAKKLKIPVSELLRRAALAYQLNAESTPVIAPIRAKKMKGSKEHALDLAQRVARLEERLEMLNGAVF